MDKQALTTIDRSKAKLPQSYTEAKTAIAECYNLDEVKSYADKAEALATYARQIEDDEMERTAQLIKARAVRRAGEILATFQESASDTIMRSINGGIATGTTVDSIPIYPLSCPECDAKIECWVDDRCPECGIEVVTYEPAGGGDIEPVTQRQAAKRAGFSKRQEVQASRAAKIPEADFERELERPGKPPTVTELADMGRKARPAVPPRMKDPLFTFKYKVLHFLEHLKGVDRDTLFDQMVEYENDSEEILDNLEMIVLQISHIMSKGGTKQ